MGPKNHGGRRRENLCFSYSHLDFRVPKMRFCAHKCYLPYEKHTLPHLFIPVCRVPLRYTLFVYLLAGWRNTSPVRNNLQLLEYRLSLPTAKQGFMVTWRSITLVSAFLFSFLQYCCEHILIALCIGLLLTLALMHSKWPASYTCGFPSRLSQAVKSSFLKLTWITSCLSSGCISKLDLNTQFYFWL